MLSRHGADGMAAFKAKQDGFRKIGTKRDQFVRREQGAWPIFDHTIEQDLAPKVHEPARFRIRPRNVDRVIRPLFR